MFHESHHIQYSHKNLIKCSFPSYLAAPQDPSLQDVVSLRDVDADVDHLVITPLEASPQVLNGDDEASEERLEQFTHGLLGLLMGTLNDHHDGLIHELMVEMRNFKIQEASEEDDNQS